MFRMSSADCLPSAAGSTGAGAGAAAGASATGAGAGVGAGASACGTGAGAGAVATEAVVFCCAVWPGAGAAVAGTSMP